MSTNPFLDQYMYHPVDSFNHPAQLVSGENRPSEMSCCLSLKPFVATLRNQNTPLAIPHPPHLRQSLSAVCPIPSLISESNKQLRLRSQLPNCRSAHDPSYPTLALSGWQGTKELPRSLPWAPLLPDEREPRNNEMQSSLRDLRFALEMKVENGG